ncbi:hypothetical protein XPA_009117 [Xanthoria parietina]
MPAQLRQWESSASKFICTAHSVIMSAASTDLAPVHTDARSSNATVALYPHRRGHGSTGCAPTTGTWRGSFPTRRGPLANLFSTKKPWAVITSSILPSLT